MYVDLVVADRLAPLARSAGPEDEIVERYRTVVQPYAGRIRFAVAAFFAVVMASGVASEWRNWVLFKNASKFGIKDPQFHKDIGFYVFKLPFLEFIAGWTFAALLVILIVTLVFHYLNGGIRLQTPFQRVTPQVKVHISVILALMALTKTVQYYLARFGLTLSHRGVVDGATYTDVKAQLPALNLLMLISVAAAILFIANIFRKGWVFPIIAVGLWGFISIVVGTIYPAVIQRFVVQPNEYARSRRTSSATSRRRARRSGSTRSRSRPFDYNDRRRSPGAVRSREPGDARQRAALGSDPLKQRIAARPRSSSPSITFSDVDIDRYDVNGTLHAGAQRRARARLVAAPEQHVDEPPPRVHARLRRRHRGGELATIGDQPDYLLSDIPADRASSPLTQPDVYFGEGFSGYSVVDSKVAEQEANGEPSTDDDASTRATAACRCRASARRLAFALRFGDFNLVYSGQLTSQSRILYLRDIQRARRDRGAVPAVGRRSVRGDPRRQDRVGARRVHDDEPLPVLAVDQPDGRSGSGLDTNINYVRNSVKATVDAYDGTVHFYVVDTKDPIIRTYEKAFPDLFDHVNDMPAGLREHWRYPEDIFKVQTEQYTQYHMTDPQQFFQKVGAVGRRTEPRCSEPSRASAGAPVTAAPGGDNGGRNSHALRDRATPIDPLYLMMQLPGRASGQEFVLQRPFVPIRKANQLSSFMVARQDGENYGKLVAVPGARPIGRGVTARAASLIEADPTISRNFSLLDQHRPTVFAVTRSDPDRRRDLLRASDLRGGVRQLAVAALRTTSR